MGIGYRPSFEQADEDYPLILCTGRTLYHYNAATQTRRVEGVVDKQDGCFIEMNPTDAARYALSQGARTRVSTRRGEVEANVRITERVGEGRIWMALHWAEARANLLTTAVGDAVTGTGEYKVCAARVQPL